MDATEVAAQINGRLSKDVVPMDELRARADGDNIVLEGTRVGRHPQGRRAIFAKEPERSDPTFWATFPPDEALHTVEELMRNWPMD